MPHSELIAAQQEDPTIGRVLHFMQVGSRPTYQEKQKESASVRQLLHEWNKLFISEDGILCHKCGSRDRMVLPKKYHIKVYEELHENMGHLGADRVVELARERFYWPFMRADITHYVTKVCHCLKQRKPATHVNAPLQPIVSTTPFQLVSMDFVHLEPSSGGYQYILVIMDHYTRFAQAYATRDKSAKTAADKLYNDFIMRFGFPETIHHDQGGEFENKLFYNLEKLSGIKHSRTTPYHPQGNGQVERFNRTLLSMLRALPEKQKSRWRDHLNKVVHAYNCTRHDSTGFSPFYLLFGRNPRLPIDLMFGLKPPEGFSTYPEYVRNWRRAMKEAYDLASAHAKKSADMGKQQYDKKVRHTALCEGDRVLVRNMSERGGPGKLRPYWEQEIYVVTQKRKDMPVYEVKPESGNGRSKVLHRNMLLPCSYLPVETPLKSSKSRRTVSRRSNRQQASQEETTGTTDEDISLTPDKLQQLYESTRQESYVVEEDIDPCIVDSPDSEGEEEEDPEQPVGTVDDEAADSLPIRQSHRMSRPPLRMTYDVMGQPSFQTSSTAGIQGVTVSYPQQLWQPVTVSWMLQPVLQPYSYFAPFPVSSQPMYPPSARSLQFAKNLFESSKGTVNYDRLSVGILVGGVKSMELSYSDRQTISIARGVTADDVPGIGWCSRSLWKPEHSFEGLLYRVGEHVIFADPDKGDTVAVLECLFSVRIDNVSALFCKGKHFEYDGATDIGLKKVCPTDEVVIFEASLLSRKVMLFARNDNDEQENDLREGQCFILVDYMRRVFPVTEGTVVVPYYPVVHDMVEIKGNDGQVWKACALSFNLTRLTVNARFFVEDGTEPGKWVPERSPVQVIHFNSVLGISKGYWQVAYSCWIDEEE
ncbi:hypothetical protein ACROYT_G013913 [Oculina patagonica]